MMNAAAEKLCSIRHYCFVRGVLEDQDDFRQAFRTLNRLYVQASHSRGLKGQVYRGQKPAVPRRRAA